MIWMMGGHSCRPNVTRQFFGTLVTFRAITDIPAGVDLCISYIESEALAEKRTVRRSSLMQNWDFECHCSRCEGEEDSSDCDVVEVFGSELRNYLSELPPQERLKGLEVGRQLNYTILFQEIRAEIKKLSSDVGVLFDHKLRALSELGVVNLQLGRWRKAWDIFTECRDLAKRRMGVNDEALICFNVHRAFASAALFFSSADNWSQRARECLTEAFRYDCRRWLIWVVPEFTNFILVVDVICLIQDYGMTFWLRFYILQKARCLLRLNLRRLLCVIGCRKSQ